MPRPVTPRGHRALPCDSVVRPLAAADVAQVRALLDAEAAHNPYARRARDLLDSVTPAGEYQALVCARQAEVLGTALFGLVAGAEAAGVIHAVTVHPGYRRRGIGHALVDAVTEALRQRGARFALVELPDDPAVLPGLRDVLVHEGYDEVARVPDLYRDGVALAFLRRTL